MDIEERLGQLIDEQHGVTVMLSQKARNKYIQRRDALRNEIAADWREREELAAELVEALKRVRAVIGERGRTNKNIYVSMPGECTLLIDHIAKNALARVKGE